MNEAWKPLPECLDDDLWPCVRPAGWPAAFPLYHATSLGGAGDGRARRDRVSLMEPHAG